MWWAAGVVGAVGGPSLDAGIVLGAAAGKQPPTGEALGHAGDVGRGPAVVRPRVRDALRGWVAGRKGRHQREPSG